MSTKAARIAPFVKARNLRTTGFRETLRDYVATKTNREDDEDDADFEETVEHIFGEWFGDLGVVPAAYTLTKGERAGWDELHVYEVENSTTVPLHKFSVYGRIADGDGPLVTLHILDRYNNEIVVENSDLECFAFIDLDRRPDEGGCYLDMMRNVRQNIVRDPPPLTDCSLVDRLEKERNRRHYKRFCENKGVDGMRAMWREQAARHREARRKRSREAYARRSAALKLIQDIQEKGLEALT